MTGPPRDRLLSSIQILRAVAAWLVVFHHYTATFKASHASWVRVAVYGHGAMGVDIFFVISGLVMGLGAGDPAITPRVFAVRRLARIVPAYWVTTAAVALVIVYAPAVLPGWGLSLPFLVKSLLFVPAISPSGAGFYPVNTVGWTLNFEMVFYLIVALALLAQRPRRGLWIAAGIVVLQQLLSQLGIVSAFYADPIVYEFAMGIVAARLWQSGALRGPSWVFGCLGLVAAACFVRSPAFSGSRTIEWGLPAFLLVCACLGLERHMARGRWLVALGDHSYSVYLIHPVIIATGWYVQHTLRWNAWLVAAGCFAVIAGLGAASYHLLERPAGRLLTRQLLRRRDARPAQPEGGEGRTDDLITPCD